MKETINKKILKEASVLLIAVVMVLSAVSTTANTTDAEPTIGLTDDGITRTVEEGNGVTFGGDTFYGYDCMDDNLVSFESDNPGTFTIIASGSSSDFLAGGTCDDNRLWWACEYGIGNSNIWTIDEVTGVMTMIGPSGVPLTGIAYDTSSGTMYGGYIDKLYTIDMDTADATFVGSMSGHFFIGIAFDGDGNLYGINLADSSLYSFNPDTAAVTLIGSTGLSLNYAQDMAYDINNGILYLSAYDTLSGGGLYTCNIATGRATLVGNFPGNTEVAGFAIPYSLPPETPEQPVGPGEGVTGEEYTFSTSTTDPEGDQVSYFWDWGDGTPGEWTDFYDSGAMVDISHIWTEAGEYEIRVKAKDIYDVESTWSDPPKTIHIVECPILEVDNITGNLFRVSTVIRNTGGVDATRVDWSITFDGGFIPGGDASGSILCIPAGDEEKISSGLIFGFGRTVITATAECAEGSSDTKTRDAFVFLFFIF